MLAAFFSSTSFAFSAATSVIGLRHAFFTSLLLAASYLTARADDDDSLPASVQGIVSTPFTAEPPTPTDLSLLIWLAANDKLDPNNLPKAYATKSWPEEVIVKGLRLEVQPGHMPTVKASPTNETPTSTTTSPTPTTSATTTHDSASSSITTPRRSAGEFAQDGDRKVAIVLGVFICLVAFSVLAVVMLLLWRRKRTTGNFFKPARYSLASEMIGTGQRETSEAALLSPVKHSSQQLDKDHHPGDVERAAEYFSATQLSRISEAQDSDIYDGTRGSATISHPADRDSGSQYVTTRSVDGYNPRLITPSSARWAELVPSEQSFELSAESPSHMAAQRIASQSQLEVVEEAVESEDTISTPTPTQAPRLQSGFAPAAGERRSMVVTMSPTNSSTSILEDANGLTRTNTMSSYSTEHSERERGESLDTVTPIVTPAPSYRDRRPADLLLPSATKRFRDQRLPLVHFPDETASPGISTPCQNSASPRHDSGAVLASGTGLSPGVSPLPPGLSPVASPGRVSGRVSPIGRFSPTPVVHYPSREEISSFEFEPDPESPPEPPSRRSSGYRLQPTRYSSSGR